MTAPRQNLWGDRPLIVRASPDEERSGSSVAVMGHRAGAPDLEATSPARDRGQASKRGTKYSPGPRPPNPPRAIGPDEEQLMPFLRLVADLRPIKDTAFSMPGRRKGFLRVRVRDKDIRTSTSRSWTSREDAACPCYGLLAFRLIPRRPRESAVAGRRGRHTPVSTGLSPTVHHRGIWCRDDPP